MNQVISFTNLTWNIGQESFTDYTYATPALGNDGTIYMPGGDTLYAFNPDGTVQWQINEVAATRTSPAIGQDGTIYIGIWNGNDTFFALNPDGTTKWSKYIGATGYSCPAIDALGTVYVGTAYKVFYAFRDENLPTPSLQYPTVIMLLILVSVLLIVGLKRKVASR